MSAEVRVRAWMVALAILALLLAGLAWQVSQDSGPDRATRTAAPACADIRLVLVPGNAQGSTTDAGATLNRFAQRFGHIVAGRRTLDRVVVANPSKSVRVLGARFPRRPANSVITSAQVRGWESGINTAATAALRAATASVASCPNTALVLAGYSQGAGAVHRAMTKVARGTVLSRRIIGTVLIGDPDRAQHTRALSQLRPAASGIEYVKRIQIADVPSARSPITTYSVCLYGDLICAFGAQSIRTGIAVHNRYPTADASLYDNPSRAIANVAVAIPRVTPGAPPMTAVVGDQFRQAIPIRVVSSAIPKIVFTAQSALPPGLQLTSGGLLTGLPTTTGTTRLQYRVQNTTSPKYGLPVVGFITLTVKPSQGLQISTGGESACVVRLNHALNCWGANGYGQIGDGTRTDKRVPTRVGTGVWNDVATSGTHTCGVRTSATVWCWGSNRYGQIGDGSTTDRLRPTQVAPFGKWRTVSVSNFNSCALSTAGALWCWGNNIWGQVGNGTTTTALRPKSLGSGWTSVSSGAWGTCGTKVGGALYCWGANDFGQLGDGTITRRTVPTRIGAGFNWTGVSIGSMHTCGLLASGGLRCWGTNYTGQLGDGSTTSSTRPVAVFGDSVWRDVAAGDRFTCGVKTDSSVWCWGSGALGQRGSTVRSTSPTPVRVASSFAGARISAGWSFACGVDSATLGTLSCWGFNNRGQLGDGTTALKTEPKRVNLP